MSMKLALSVYIEHFSNRNRYKAICFVIDSWFHVHRGYKDPNIDYIAMGLRGRELLIKHLGMRVYKKDICVKKKVVPDQMEVDEVSDDDTLMHFNDESDNEEKVDRDQRISNVETIDEVHYALKLIPKNLTFGKPQGLFTRFTGHNAFWHMFTDMDNWGNLNIANCKQNEKTNKNTKEALKRGRFGSNYCNRIMKYYKDLYIGTYLLEGNCVTDDGFIDPFNGDHSVDTKILSKLTNLKWMSIFWDMKYNPHDPQYKEGYEFKKKVKWNSDQWSDYFLDYNDKDFAKTPFNSFEDVQDVTWYYSFIYWRHFSSRHVKRGTMMLRKNAVPNTAHELCLALGFGRASFTGSLSKEFVVGHKINIKKYSANGDRNVMAEIKDELICWELDEIRCNVRYSHVCGRECKFVDNEKIHNWKNKRIALFWFIGMGSSGIGDPLRNFEGKYFELK